MLGYVLQFKREAKRFDNKLVENNLYLIAHNGARFDSHVVSKNLPQWRTIVNIKKNVAGFVSPKIFNAIIDKNKKSSLRCTF